MIRGDQYIIFRETGSTDPRAGGGGGRGGEGRGGGVMDGVVVSTLRYGVLDTYLG